MKEQTLSTVSCISAADDPRHETPLPFVFEQIGMELTAIADAVHLVEETIGEMVATGPENTKNAILSLQKIDMISQSLRAIANFSMSLSRSIPEEWQVDAPAAAKGVLLSDLARRLGCSLRHVSWGTIKVEGDWELFD